MTQRSSFSTVMLISVLVLSGFSLGAGRLPRDLPVISILEGNLPEGNLPGDYRILSDGQGPYLNGSGGVESILQGIGDWVLDTQGNDSTRMVFVDLTDQAREVNGATLPFETGLVFGRFIAQSASGPVPIRFMTGLNSQIVSPLVFAFGHETERYRIVMNSHNFLQTDDVLVKCTGVSGSGQCNASVIEPSVTHEGELKNKAQLLGISTKKGKIVETDLGDFYLSFRITITTQ
jgi:hypothetical protein